MRYDVEREIDGRWYPVAAPRDSGSAAQAVACVAVKEGLYRARLADRPGGIYELFRVPAWGQPNPIGTA